MDVLKPVDVFEESIIGAFQQVASTVLGRRNFDKKRCFRSFRVFLSRRAAKAENLRRDYVAEVQALLTKRRIFGKHDPHKEDAPSVDQVIGQLQPFKEGNEELVKILFFLLLIEEQPQSSSNDRKEIYDFQRCLNTAPSTTVHSELYGFGRCLLEEDATDTNSYNEEFLCLLSTHAQRHMRRALTECQSRAITKRPKVSTCYEFDLTAGALNDLYLQASCRAYLGNKGPLPTSIVYVAFDQLKEFVRRLFSGISSDVFVYNKAEKTFTIGMHVSLDGITLHAFQSSMDKLLKAGANSRHIWQLITQQQPPFCRTIERFRSALEEAYCEQLKATMMAIDHADSLIALLISLQPSIRWLSFFGTVVSELNRRLQESNGNTSVCWLWNALYNSSYLCNSTDSFLSSSLHYCMCCSLRPFLRTLEIAANECKWYDPYQEFQWLHCSYMTGNVTKVQCLPGKENVEETLEDLFYFPPEDMPPFMASRIASLMSYLRYCFVLKKCTNASEVVDFKFTAEPMRLSKEEYGFSKLIGQKETKLMSPVSVRPADALEEFFAEKFSQERFQLVDSCLWQHYVNNLDILGVFRNCNRIFFGGDATSTFWPTYGESLFPLIVDRLEPSQIAKHKLMKRAANFISQKCHPLKMNFALTGPPPKFVLRDDQFLSWIKPHAILTWPLSLALPERSIRIYEQMWRLLCYANFSDWYVRTVYHDLVKSWRSDDHLRDASCCVYLNNVQKYAADLSSFIGEEIDIAYAIFKEDVKGVKSVDQLRRTHYKFLKAAQSRCFLCSANIHSHFMDVFKATVACCESIRSGDLQTAEKCSNSAVQRVAYLCAELTSQNEEDLRSVASNLLAKLDTNSVFASRTEVSGSIDQVNSNCSSSLMQNGNK